MLWIFNLMKKQTNYICTNCGYYSPVMMGKCPECAQWGTFELKIQDEILNKVSVSANPISLTQVKETDVKLRHQTGFGEFDRVLGGGLVAGSVVLVAGDPGIGKSTLLLESAVNIAKDNPKKEVLYVSGEESAYQIKLRSTRIAKDIPDNLKVLAETDVEVIVSTIEKYKYELVIVDSIQTIQTPSVSGSWGSLVQIRESTLRFAKVAKSLHIPIMIVGHVTKEGEIAGPKILEHLVDVVLVLEGDQFGIFRILRASKNRYGSTSEVGIFEMRDKGLVEVKNPSELFLSEWKDNLPGSVIFPSVQGDRPILVEVQALVTPSLFGNPRRVATGVDYSRLQNIIAVLTKFGKLPLGTCDVVVNVAGGMNIKEPAMDLAVAVAIYSAVKNKALKANTVVFGELGLLGEVRRVSFDKKRVEEAKKLGFNSIVQPDGLKNIIEAMRSLQ
ncbi:DNA repair protein RadA [Candidatus Curtissbacteria bacterium]|nr:DNA repair protein RadA [Candidatus Curtissbacteria bacterium]